MNTSPMYQTVLQFAHREAGPFRTRMSQINHDPAAEIDIKNELFYDTADGAKVRSIGRNRGFLRNIATA